MGQYYIAIILKEKVENSPEKIKSWMYSHDYGCGLKLMEHSWMKNPFVQSFEFQLSPEGQHHKSRVVWGGDSADNEADQTIMYEGKEEPITLYGLCKDGVKMKPSVKETFEKYPFIINHTKKEYVDKRKTPDNDGWRIHPLPLLTCEGNGRGGGDFRGEHPIIGSWARDVISIEEDVPTGFKQLDFELVE